MAGWIVTNWRSCAPLPADNIINCCYAVAFRGHLVAATTVAAPGERPRSVFYASAGGLTSWTELAPPPVDGAHTIDALCVESLRARLFAIIRRLDSNSPCEVWNFVAADVLDGTGCWTLETKVPNGHHCGAYTTCRNFFVAAGGRLAESPPNAQKAVDAYSLDEKYWVDWPELPVPLYASSAINISDQKVVIVGGVQGDDPEQFVANLHVLSMEVMSDEAKGPWNLSAPLDSPCLAPSAVGFRGELVVYRSLSDYKDIHCPVQWWDRTVQRWRALKAPPIPRVDACLAMFDGRLISLGGQLLEDGSGAVPKNSFCGHVHDIKILWQDSQRAHSYEKGRRQTLI